MKEYKFYKLPSGKWYIDLPEWEGSIDDLEMVMGADNMLDIVAQGDDVAYLTFSENPFENANILIREKLGDSEGGAYYDLKEYNGIPFNLNMWLCDVTSFVFGHLPEKIYFK